MVKNKYPINDVDSPSHEIHIRFSEENEETEEDLAIEYYKLKEEEKETKKINHHE
jgi:hypothetical protein